MFQSARSTCSKKQGMFNLLLDSLNDLEQKKEEDTQYIETWVQVFSGMDPEHVDTVVQDIQAAQEARRNGERHTLNRLSMEVILRVVLTVQGNTSMGPPAMPASVAESYLHDPGCIELWCQSCGYAFPKNNEACPVCVVEQIDEVFVPARVSS